MIAKTGGVVQIPFGIASVDPQAAANTQAHFRATAELHKRNAAHQAAGQPLENIDDFDKQWAMDHPVPDTQIAAVLDQIDYAVKLVGADHIGLGSDFDGVSGELPKVCAAWRIFRT